MKLSTFYEPIVESGFLPDFITRQGIRALLARRIQNLPKDPKDYILNLKNRKLAINVKEANEQHYEVDTEFFKLSLGLLNYL